MEYYKIPFFEIFNFLMIRLNSALYQIVLNNTNVWTKQMWKGKTTVKLNFYFLQKLTSVT